VSDLLCRVGHDSPHFIIYPAIVGASRRTEKKTDTDSVTGKLLVVRLRGNICACTCTSFPCVCLEASSATIF
jgi:hypothetical protein